MDAKTEFELDYWRQVRTGHAERYRAILDRWGVHSANSVLEIGTGPLGGCLPYITAHRKVGLDPLYSVYERMGLWKPQGPAEYIDGTVETFATDERFDLILSMNALDHGDSDFGCIARIAELLAPGGRFCLHVHLRTPEQLNVGHDHALRFEDLIAATENAGLRTVRLDLHETDPVEGCAYKTAIGVWEKQ